MKLICLVAAVLLVHSAHAIFLKQETNAEKACTAEDLGHRIKLQNKMASICEDMCKEVGAYPKCSQCVDFASPDDTPGVLTWDELLDHMDNLVTWGEDMIKNWKKTASALQKKSQLSVASILRSNTTAKLGSCQKADLEHRAQLQNKLASICEDMCKEVGAYPKCSQCVDFASPDDTPGVLTWDELLDHMDNLVTWGEDMIKNWKKTASALQKSQAVVVHTSNSTEKSCTAQDLQNRVKLQNKMASICEDMCKEVGAYPKCSQCVDFASPDDTPGVLTWDELLDHMDNLVTWGEDMIKNWKKTASALQKVSHTHVAAIAINSNASSKACQEVEDHMKMLFAAKLQQIQTHLGDICVEMCKQVGSYPKCLYCKGYEADMSPGKLSWDELFTKMQDLMAKDQEMLKSWGH